MPLPGSTLPGAVPPDPFTVSQLTERIQNLLTSSLPALWVKGEVSNLRKQASGHTYFALKDGGAQIAAVLFRGQAARQTATLREGGEYVVHGEIDVYPPRGTYQLIVRTLFPEGEGALQEAFARLKNKLEAEGLFAAARKRALPVLPRTVAVITSPTGAAVRDFLSVLNRHSWPGRVIVCPARVQGREAPAEIVARLAAVPRLPSVDLVVLARGGGSLEDLWSFNEEVVVRAIAACPVPVVSAVGHEIDFTLSDFVADQRAETPTAAAEMLGARWTQTAERLLRLRRDLCAGVDHAGERARWRLGQAVADLREQSPRRALEQAALRVDDLRVHLLNVLQQRQGESRQQLAIASGALGRHHPRLRLAHARAELAAVNRRLHAAAPRALTARRERLEAWAQRLRNLSPEATLQRGYALVRDEDGRLVTDAAVLAPDDRVSVRFRDGERRARIQHNPADDA